MFAPKNFKFRKQQKGKNISKILPSRLDAQINCIKLKTLGFGRLTSNQMKALKQTINKIMKKRGRAVFKVFPQTPITKKPIEVRMGKGKGAFSHWIAKIQPGTTICYIESEFSLLTRKALEYAKIRLPIKTKITN
jgi:large subunit ribosomal protein L16